MHLYEKNVRLKEENERYLSQIRFLDLQLSHKTRESPTSVTRLDNDSEERVRIKLISNLLYHKSLRKYLLKRNIFFCY